MRNPSTGNSSLKDRAIPRHSFIATTVLTMVTFAALLIHASDAQTAARGIQATSLEIERVCGQVVYLDEALTMSALMCAPSGDLEWEHKYDELEQLLDHELLRAHRFAPEITGSKGSTLTSSAHEGLLELEALSFELVRVGRLEDALDVMKSEEYASSKEIYSEGSESLLLVLRAHMNLMRSRLARRQLQMITGTCAAIAVLLGLWIRVGKSMGRHDRLRDEFEKRLSHYASELEEANSELGSARESAELASLAKGEFVATVSHELRTPMNGVIGCASLLADSELTEEQLEYVEAIQASGETLLALINDVLDFSKMEAGKMTLEQRPESPIGLVHHVHSMLSQAAKAKELDFRVVVESGVPEIVLIDSVRIGQILTNLIGNAIKFTDKGEVVLGLSCRESATETVELCFSVKDSGIGVSPETLPSLFNDFVQADNSTSRKFGGTGLGLAISQRLVQMMGGKISAESTIGMGSTFTVAIPTQIVVERVAAPKVEAPAEEDIFACVMLVEDNVINQMVASRMLSKLGCKVVLAASGQECLDALEESSIDLILMDCQMPVMDGYEASRQICSASSPHQEVPIVAVTANAGAQDRNRCFDVGMTDYLTKPIQFQELRETLERNLNRVSSAPDLV